MKIIIEYLLKKAKGLFTFLCLCTSIIAYPQTCEVTLRNDSLIDANNLIVDIYVKSTSGIFYYSAGQFKVTFNETSIANGGSVTPTIVAGFSELTNPAQIPNNIIDNISNWRLTSRLFPETQAECSLISSAGIGTRICRVKLTNTVPFGESAADMLIVTIPVPATAIWYANEDGSVGIAGVTMVNANLVNPILNSPITSFNVTGSGCSPSEVGLNGSQANGVKYILYKNEILQGVSLDGTGSAISFGTLTDGTYTIKGHRTATYMYAVMNGDATIGTNLPVSVSVGASSNPICSGSSVTFTAAAVNGGTTPSYQWKLNNADVGTNSATYINSALSNGDNVKCVMTSSGSCTTGNPAISNEVVMTVNINLPVSVSVGASSNPICSGSSVTFTATAVNGGTTPSYQWKLNDADVGTNSATYINSALSGGDKVKCVMTSSGSCTTGNPATSNEVVMTVNTILPASVIIGSSANPVCSGTSVTFNATPANGGTSPSYQWKINGVNVGTNVPVYTYIPDNGDKVTCVMTSNATCVTGSPATSNPITMTVNNNLLVGVLIGASANPACSGSSVTFTATQTNGGTTPSYQWKLNDVNVGINSASYINSTLTSGDKVKCVMTSSSTCTTGNPATSNEVVMTINTNLPVSVSVGASSNPICSGSSVTFTATAVNGGTTPSYQWKLNNADVGTNSATYMNSALSNGDKVTCVMISSGSCTTGNPATSNEVVMTVNTNLPVSVSVGASSNPICSGSSVTFTATAVNGGTTPSYQWKLNNADVGTNSATYINSALSGGDKVKCVMTSSGSCTTGNPATSNEVVMTVNANLPVSVSVGASSNPICSGSSVTFTSTGVNGGTSPSYQWYKNSIAVGTNSSAYSFVPVTGDKVYVVLTSSLTCATGNPATSNEIVIAVDPNLPVSVSIGASSSAICSGNPVTFTATPTNGGTTPSYQWKLNNANVGTNSATYINSALANGDKVKCVMTSNVICPSGNPSTSNEIAMTVNPILNASVLIGTSSNPVCTGTSVTFNATPANGGLSPSYQWKVNGFNVGTNLPVYNYTPLNGDIVTCIMTSNASCVTGNPATSNSVTMTVNNNLPVSVSVGASANPACSGSSVTFTATQTNGGTSPSYQWYKNSIAVGTNSSSYSFVPVTGDKVYVVLNSNFTCAIGNPATSNEVIMTVNTNLPVSVSIGASSNPICSGIPVTFTAVPVNGGTTPSYQWKLNDVNIGTNSATYINSTLANGDKVKCVMTSNTTCPTANPATSNEIPMVVNPNYPVSISISASSNPTCAGSTVTFTATPANSGTSPVYQWKLDGVNIGTNNPVYSYTPVNGDIVTCVLTSNVSCATGNPAISSAISLIVTPKPAAPKVGVINQPTCVVATGSVTLTDLPAGTWTINPGGIVGSSANKTISGLLPGMYTFTVTNSLLCTSVASENVVIDSQPLTPSAPIIGIINQPSCDGSVGSVVLDGLPQGAWNLIRTPGDVETNGTGISTTVPGLEEGTYSFLVTNSDGCTSVASENVVIGNVLVPTIIITNPAPVCSPSTIDLTSASITEGSSEGLSYSYWMNPEATLPLSNPESADGGTYYIKGTSTLTTGCFQIRSVIVSVSQMAVADAGRDQVLEYLFTTTLDAEPAQDNEVGAWSVLSGTGEFLDNTYARTSVSGLSLAENKLIWMVNNGVCPSSFDTVSIVVNDLLVPTLITPNMDGINDYFVLRGLETLGKTEITIFDRRGAQVYKNSDYDNSWNGVDYNDKPLLDDTYFYVLKTENGKSISGYIVIRR